MFQQKVSSNVSSKCLTKCLIKIPHQNVFKLDGVGPVDNRQSTDKLHQVFEKKKREKIVTCDTWHVTCDMWHVGGDEYSLKISAP